MSYSVVFADRRDDVDQVILLGFLEGLAFEEPSQFSQAEDVSELARKRQSLEEGREKKSSIRLL